MYNILSGPREVVEKRKLPFFLCFWLHSASNHITLRTGKQIIDQKNFSKDRSIVIFWVLQNKLNNHLGKKAQKEELNKNSENRIQKEENFVQFLNEVLQ
jgi:hypothetical protein